MNKVDILICIAAGALLVLAIGCSTDLDTDPGGPTTDVAPPQSLEPEELTLLCHRACPALTGVCDVADDPDGQHVECVETCKAGAFSVEELHCLAAAPCGDAKICFVPR